MAKSSDIISIAVGETWRHAGMVAKASGSAITSGTVNYYLKAKSGANAGKWWKNSDQTWAAVETANAMTHDADGNWTIELAASPFSSGVLYLEYAKESGDLHVAGEGRLLRGQADAAVEAFAAVLTTQMTEAYAADGVAPTLAQAIFLIQQSLHEFAIVGATRTVKKLDGTATAATFTLNSETAPTSTTRAS